MTCKKCGAAMIGRTCPPCTVRSLKRLERELGDELGGGICEPDGMPLVDDHHHPLGAGTYSNRLDDGPSRSRYWATVEDVKYWFRARDPRGANGKPVIDVDVREVDPDPDAKALTRIR